MIIQTIHMKSVTAEGQGTLSVFEGSRDVPFDIKRIYYIHGAPQRAALWWACCVLF